MPSLSRVPDQDQTRGAAQTRFSCCKATAQAIQWSELATNSYATWGGSAPRVPGVVLHPGYLGRFLPPPPAHSPSHSPNTSHPSSSRPLQPLSSRHMHYPGNASVSEHYLKGFNSLSKQAFLSQINPTPLTPQTQECAPLRSRFLPSQNRPSASLRWSVGGLCSNHTLHPRSTMALRGPWKPLEGPLTRLRGYCQSQTAKRGPSEAILEGLGRW